MRNGSRSRRGLTWLCGPLLLAMGMAWAARPAFAIPAFARKYETSCHTCHTAYPKLNPFGVAFRLRGYRMPGETEDMVKEEPVSMGADANKRMFPKSLWPSSIPRTVPLSVDTQSAVVTEHDAESGETITNDFKFPEGLNLLAGGTFGDLISFFAEVEIELEDEEEGTEVEVGVEHAEMHFNGPWGTGSKLNVKVGRFVPEISQPFSHGSVLTEGGPAVMFAFNPVGFHGSSTVGAGGHHGGGGSGIALPGGVDGIEIYGILNHRFDYSVGVSNGIGPGDETRDGNESKDLFARLGYKIGGMPLDGEGEDYVQDPKNWREKSVRFGVFAYEGDGGDIFFEGTGHHAGSFVEDREFNRYGVDINAYIQDVNLIFGYVSGEDTLAEFTSVGDEGDEHGEDEHGEDEHGEPELEFDQEGTFDYEAWFLEADVVFFPWLHGAVRYEWLDPSNTRSENFERYTVNLTALIRANVKAYIEYREDAGGDMKDNYTLRGVLRWAF